ncbi:MAG: phosphatase PAP2 family protein [Bdellovibrionota bacterium]
MAVDLRNRFISSILLFAWIIAAYAIPNNVVFFAPYVVPLTAVDQLIPLSSPWVWIYVSYYPFIYFAYFAARSAGNAKRYLVMMSVSAGIAMFIFLFFPTIIFRGEYPVVGDEISAQALALIRTLDNSVNCLPSMHIAMSCMAAYTYGSESRKWILPAYAWAALIAYSTMATKQHYFWDVVGGMALASTMIILSNAAVSRYLGQFLSRSSRPHAR